MRLVSRSVIAVAAFAFLASHIFVLAIEGSGMRLASFAWLVAAPAIAAAACFRRAARDGLEGWLAAGIAMTCWAGGMASVTIAATLLDIGDENRMGILLFVLYAVPLIFALASLEVDRWPMRLVDAALAVALGYLFYVYVERYTTMAGTTSVNTGALALMFDIQNIYIAAFALLRLMSCTPARVAFFRAIAAYAVTYGLAAGYMNHFQYDTPFGVWLDVLIDVPFLLLAGMALRPHAVSSAAEGPRRAALARVVRAGSPMLIPVTLLTVSVLLVSFDPVIAVAGCIIASLGYGLRTVLVQVRSLAEHDELSRLSQRDGLTGIANRRRFDEVLHREWARRSRSSGQLVLLMIDIDHFKPLNDQFGHFAGDEVLRRVAGALADCARRETDVVARYGGEEFAAILPDTDPDGAAAIAERMRAAVEALWLPQCNGLTVTVSIGLACAGGPNGDVYALIGAADGALYDAKRRGRNQVVRQTAAEVVPLRSGRSARN
ncbi:GGDEF domain-containing protein [Novosphingobium sp. Leaf2]|uniref:GGDEF domain-containing protein n=1 Tax=Novosphingobium sp. Leaf2 TaxID=1735670 RepID=UPI0006F9A149|nr:GGDEF domain-containing protein [Novosphingobium sp. Leaf2]KQM19633.1 diguanylate cyclase [Novosphingobium sp. Leaf2]